MKQVNLYNMVIAKNTLSEDLRVGLYNTWGVKPKDEELNSIEYFVNNISSLLKKDNLRVAYLLSGCYFGFIIPQISKEFDCLWIGENTIVNIELKSEDVAQNRIKKQLEQNSYYLRHLSKTILGFTCETSSGNCYSINASGELVAVPFQELVNALNIVHKEKLYDSEIEDLFPPENFLVSPFNSTNEFLQRYYFLTNHQENIKKEVMNFVNDPNRGCFYAITGAPGTGKTLLTYDVARTLMEQGKQVIIGHAGSLNNGHYKLKDNGWSIYRTKDIIRIKYNHNNTNGCLEVDHFFAEDFDVIIIDEAQRCNNLKDIIDLVEKQAKKCIISFDPRQLMRDEELKYQNNDIIINKSGKNVGTLSNKIRTNKLVYNFIAALFNKKIPLSNEENDYVDVTYCSTIAEVKIVEKLLSDNGFELPKFTPKIHDFEEYEKWFISSSDSAHAVIGQEFDKVAALISPNIQYDQNGNLVSIKSYYYSECRMLYQILTRARRKIHLIIFNNPPILERCLNLINKKKK